VGNPEPRLAPAMNLRTLTALPLIPSAPGERTKSQLILHPRRGDTLHISAANHVAESSGKVKKAAPAQNGNTTAPAESNNRISGTQ